MRDYLFHLIEFYYQFVLYVQIVLLHFVLL